MKKRSKQESVVLIISDLIKGVNISKACAKNKVSRNTLYQWMRHDKLLRAQITKAKQQGEK